MDVRDMQLLSDRLDDRLKIEANLLRCDRSLARRVVTS